MVIKFYRHEEKPHGVFSNFSDNSITIDDKVWPTSEHIYQALKFPHDPAYMEQIRLAPTPKKSKNFANKNPAKERREDWGDVKDDVMRYVVAHKFTQHENLRHTLLTTGNQELIEDSPIDFYWGCGNDGSGKNTLGKVLMEVRSAIREDTIDRYITTVEKGF